MFPEKSWESPSMKFTEFLIYRIQQMANQKRRNEQLIQRKNEDVTELERR